MKGDTPAGDILQGLSQPLTCKQRAGPLLLENYQRDETDASGIFTNNSKFDIESTLLDLDQLVNIEYDMTHEERGCFLIFNQENFDDCLGLTSRGGTHQDANYMSLAASAMGFEYVRILHDLKKEEILNWIKIVSEADHSPYDAFGCAILTHGDEGDVLFARDTEIHLSEFTNPFGADNCRTLAKKPKLFFIQACRGSRLDSGITLNLLSSESCGDVVDGSVKTIPTQADFLIACSTVPGYMSWRNTANGSWFVRALYVCMERHAKTMELMRIMTRVNNVVAHYFESNTGDEFHGSKQIPSIASQLTSEVYFFDNSKSQEKMLPSNISCPKFNEAEEKENEPLSADPVTNRPNKDMPEASTKASLFNRLRRSLRRKKTRTETK